MICRTRKLWLGEGPNDRSENDRRRDGTELPSAESGRDYRKASLGPQQRLHDLDELVRLC